MTKCLIVNIAKQLEKIALFSVADWNVKRVIMQGLVVHYLFTTKLFSIANLSFLQFANNIKVSIAWIGIIRYIL